MQAIHILGLAHSGTTIMDRILSCHSGSIGLGEVERVFPQLGAMQSNGKQCSCGALAGDCTFWGKFIRKSFATPEDLFREAALEASRQGYKWLTDTSKAMHGTGVYLDMVEKGDLDGVTMVRIIRDPRGWVASMMRRNEVSDEEGVRRLFDRWLVTSLMLDQRVQRPGGRCLYVWYDKMVLDRHEKQVAALLGLPETDGDIDLTSANQHALAGNQFKSLGRSQLRYDGRWMESRLLEDIFAEMTTLRHYYQEVRKLHLSDKASIEGLPKLAELRVLSKAIADGAPGEAFAKLHADLNVTVSDGRPEAPVSAASQRPGRLKPKTGRRRSKPLRA